MKKYKPSIFNVIVDSQDDGKKLMFNTLTSAFCLLDVEAQQILSNIESQDETAPMIAGNSKIIEQLVSLGFLVNEDFNELAFVELQSNVTRYGNKSLTLTIGPTLDCNMCCPYCFQDKHRKPMTAETAEKLIRFLTEYIDKNQICSVYVSWYGGEPLLEMERIEQISNGLIPFCTERNIVYSADIVTNGFLLSRNYAERLKKIKVEKAQITIDGLEETHNHRRILKNGGGSFKTIINNIESAKDLLRITIRVNVDEDNFNEIDSLADFFINEMSWKKNPFFYLAPVEKCTDACKADPEKCLQPDSFSQLRQRIVQYQLQNGSIDNLQQLYPYYRQVGCGAVCTNYFIIDSSGSFYLCWNHFGDPKKIIGSIDDPQKIGTNYEYLKWLTISLPDKCKQCAYLPLCQGGCPDRRAQNQNEPYCSYFPSKYIDDLKLVYSQYRNQSV